MLLDAQQPAALQDYLRRLGWLDRNETVSSVEKPGEGNMNYTLRVRTPVRTLIVKQARGYVEKYPTIAAPAERAIIEGRFYEAVQHVPMLAGQMPQLLGIDEANYLLVMEDLGEASDYTSLYQPGQQLSDADATALTAYLSELHIHFQAHTPDPAFANRGMRLLNHEHLFNYPFVENNGFDLDTVQPGLAELALPYQRDADLKRKVEALGHVYTADARPGNTLLHGDYYPGSWLKTTDGVKVIDPEFCFYGPAEFDLGVMLAHLMLARQSAATIDTVLNEYTKPTGFSETLRKQFTGVEIMRRLIGLAQLPVSLSLDQKRVLLSEARTMFS